jgi:hypothetical protein
VKELNTTLKNTVLVFAVIFFIFVRPVNAEETTNPNCTLEEKQRLRELASATKTTYEFKEYVNADGTTSMAYELTISNFTNNFYVWNEERGLLITYSNNSVVTAERLMPNVTYRLPFYASSSSLCNGNLILTKTVYLPPYNYYSNDPLCKGREEYELCKKHSPIKIDSYEEFVNRMQQYIKSLEQEDEQEQPTNNNKPVSIWIKIATFLVSNILYVTLPIIIAGIVIIVVIELKKRRSIL